MVFDLPYVYVEPYVHSTHGFVELYVDIPVMLILMMQYNKFLSQKHDLFYQDCYSLGPDGSV